MPAPRAVPNGFDVTTVGLRRNAATPLYEQLADGIESAISEGVLRPGDRIEPELAMSKRLEISRVTTRLAIDELVKKGLVERRQGKGTFVAQRRIRHDGLATDQFMDTLFAQGHDPSARLISFKRAEPTAEISGIFGLSAAQSLIQFDRLYSLEGSPLGIVSIWLLPEADEISRDQVAQQSSAVLLEDVLGIRLGKTDLLIHAEAAGRRAGGLLEIPARAPVLVLDRKRYLAGQKRVAEYTRFVMKAEAYQFALNDCGRDRVSSTFGFLAA